MKVNGRRKRKTKGRGREEGKMATGSWKREKKREKGRGMYNNSNFIHREL